jgi:acid phosphatase type 7
MKRPVLAMLLVSALVAGVMARGSSVASARPRPAQDDPVVATAGDIACDSSIPGPDYCHQAATSDILAATSLTAVLPLGDNQYPTGSLAEFQAYYGPTWGRELAITHPATGNHEYVTPGAAGYFDYFGAAAGDPTKGYYSIDIGTWHVIVLNSNCDEIDPGPAANGCARGSPQDLWLVADLKAHRAAKCTLAMWHHPRFSSGPSGGDATLWAFWAELYRGKADVVLNGHDHIYERFAPQNPSGRVDPIRGIRQFTVGTGGKSLDSIGPPLPNSEVLDNSSFGVLELTLHPTSYDWSFVPDPDGTLTDSGTANCH